VNQVVEKATMTVEEAALYLGISRSTCYEAIRRGDLKVVRLGGRILVPRSALGRLLGEEEPEKSGPPGPDPVEIERGIVKRQIAGLEARLQELDRVQLIGS